MVLGPSGLAGVKAAVTSMTARSPGRLAGCPAVAVPCSGGPKVPCHSCVPGISVVLRAWSLDIVVEFVGGKFMSAFVQAVGS
jgi:hypothetical protein